MGTLNEILAELSGQQYQRKLKAWDAAQIAPGTPLRKDACGAWMRWEDYGDTDSQYGWEIDHTVPVSLGGLSHQSNLRALHWKNNRAKSNSLVHNYCVVRAI